ncbi:MAG: hypothetical protein JWO68_1064 [Actinomycetia bacterium]|nr:hypothetical protein [Actinomycetes bacterium]
MRGRKPIYVESRIRSDLEALWHATQDPTAHARWDLRFSVIEYETPPGEQPRRFRYATTVAPHVTIAGTGESLGDRDRPDGSRWSGLKFWAGDRRSIIDAGAGYWRYVPTDDGIRFLTRYDYRPRWGRAGELVDRWLFRPLFGWATAWSFDRLRLWLEDGVTPERSRDLALAHAAAVAGVAGVWLYQGAVPKLLRADEDELALWRRAGFARRARAAVRAAGTAEVALGLAMAAGVGRRRILLVTVGAMPVLAAAAVRLDRRVATRAFNPVSLNWALAALAAVGLATERGRPSGRRPLRAAPDVQPDVGALP